MLLTADDNKFCVNLCVSSAGALSTTLTIRYNGLIHNTCACVCVCEGIVFKYFWGDVDTNTHTHIHIIHTIFYSHYSLSLPHTHTNTHIFCHNQYIKCFKSVFNIWLRSNMVFLFYLIIGLKCYPAAQIKPEWGRREIIKKKKGHAQIHLQGVREKLSFFLQYTAFPHNPIAG